jgi:hypothetical protein
MWLTDYTSRRPTAISMRHALDLFRHQQQIDMVGHQQFGVHPTALAHQCLLQPTEVGTPVLVVEEARRAVVAALHDVQR